MTIADRISNKRIELGYSQEDLAKICGWSNRSSISKIEKAGNNISLKKIEIVAKALHVTTAYLMGWDEEPLRKIGTPHGHGQIIDRYKISRKRFTECLDALGLTPKEFATKYKFSPQWVTNFTQEGGIDTVTRSELSLLCQALQVDAEDIIDSPIQNDPNTVIIEQLSDIKNMLLGQYVDEKEECILKAYRSADDLTKAMVRRTLGIE